MVFKDHMGALDDSDSEYDGRIKEESIEHDAIVMDGIDPSLDLFTTPIRLDAEPMKIEA
jgi:hypothetical protein